MGKKIAIIGGGGFAKEIIEVAHRLGHTIYGVFAKESSLEDFSYYGYLDELIMHKEHYDGVHIAFGGINHDQIKNRREIINFLHTNNIPSISLVSPLATLAESVEVGEGSYVAHFVYVSQDAVIGKHVIINNRADIGHDSRIDENVTISPKVFLGGDVSVGEDTLIGVGSLVKQGLKIGEGSIISMGSNVMKNIKPYSLVLAPKAEILKGFYKSE